MKLPRFCAFSTIARLPKILHQRLALVAAYRLIDSIRGDALANAREKSFSLLESLLASLMSKLSMTQH